jgi:histidine ammonia-lyase
MKKFKKIDFFNIFIKGAATEDHVSMGGWSARKSLEVISNVEYVLAIELLANCQALEFFHSVGLKTSEPLEAVYSLVRSRVEPWCKDRYMSPDIEAALKLIQNNELWTTVVDYMEKYSQDHDKLPLSVLL